MTIHEPELQRALLEFDRILHRYEDEKMDVISIKQFITSFLRTRTTSTCLPTSEIMAILKHEKPSTFYVLKKKTFHDPTFNFLTNINMDYQLAKKNLDEMQQNLQ